MTNTVRFKQQFRLEIVDLQADASHVVLRQETKVGIGATITGASENRLDARGSLWVFV